MSTYEARLARPSRAARRRDRLDGFVVPLTDEHMSEYVGSLCPAAGLADRLPGLGRHRRWCCPRKRRSSPTGATRCRSATRSTAAIGPTSRCPRPASPTGSKAMRPRAARIGYDPWLHTSDWVGRRGGAGREGRRAGRRPPQPDRRRLAGQARAVQGPPRRPARDLHRQVLGRQAPGDRRLAARAEGRCRGALRARFDRLDLQRARRRRRAHAGRPVLALVNEDGTADLFVAPEKIGDDVAPASRQRRSRPRPRGIRAASASSRARPSSPTRSAPSPPSSRRWRRPARRCVEKRDPAVLPKAIKNDAEMHGHRAAQARDGAALTRFLHWISIEAPKGNVDELIAVDRLQRSARRRRRSRRPSASTPSPAPGRTARSSITGSTRETNRPLEMDRSIWSIRAANIRTAPPTLPAPSRSARRPPRCATASPAC